MHILNHEELRSLLQHSERWCLSLYLPTHRTKPETQQDPIRFKNLLRTAESNLLNLGIEEEAARRALRPLVRLLNNEQFWRHQSEGLAVFLSDDVYRCYSLPLEVPELVVVTERFHLKPLLRILSGTGQYHLLTLTQKEVTFYEGSRFHIREIMLPNWPGDVQEALGIEEVQSHRHTRAVGNGHASHGHSEMSAVAKDRALRFFRQIDALVCEYLAQNPSLLILAGVEYLMPIYREANRYAHLISTGIHGNPDGLSREELQQHAWRLVHPHHLREREQSEVTYRELLGTGRATNRVSEALNAATQGRVATLFIPVGVHRWGSFDAFEQRMESHDEAQPGDEDLLDLTALQTLAHGGTVYAVKPDQMPDGAQAAAILRY